MTDSVGPLLDGGHERRIEAHYDGPVGLSSGAIVTRGDRWETERLHEGLKVIVVERGTIRCKLPNGPRQEVVGPCICATWNQGEHEAMQNFRPGEDVRYTMVTLSAAALHQHFAADPAPLQHLLGPGTVAGPYVSIAPACKPILGVCAQVSSLRLGGVARTLFLGGKALEIAALAITAFSEPRKGMEDMRLGSADVERLHKARALLDERLSNPPSLAELALAVGLNARKLTAGFRRVFGDSVYGYVQSRRLDTAHQLLSTSDLSVSSVAYQVGYSPAHFSVAFRKRFGLSPKDIRQ